MAWIDRGEGDRHSTMSGGLRDPAVNVNSVLATLALYSEPVLLLLFPGVTVGDVTSVVCPLRADDAALG